ncbi:kinase-like domain-containing protein [Dendryphion nanum]|uniref:Kinase-like domain-containing protein n=1 Tax=Dendryphion nanum TaxID=256645 RepID=A0A9P9D8G9_9PLEO|nr:kinase-like domain-containing protein [Dendryphion nanum]
MSLFRRPDEDTSSDSEDSSDDRGEAEGLDETNLPELADLESLSRIHTINTTTSGAQTPLSTRPALSRNNSHIHTLLLHSLLEEKTLRDASEHLGKDVGHPEVKELARTTYLALSRQLPGPDDPKYSSDEMSAHRAAAQEGLKAATKAHLARADPSGPTRALIPRTEPISGLFSMNTFLPPIATPVQLLQGYPGLHTDRYVREFMELGVVGKGGYGKVFKVKHRLDSSLYAVKRIMVSSSRLQKIQENGPQEMESLLDEVRALARFDHHNIVRYYNCWLEFTTAPTDVPLPTTVLRDDRLLANTAHESADLEEVQFGFDSLSFGDPFHDATVDSGANIVFENSDTGGGDVEDSLSETISTSFKGVNKALPRRKRRASQASQATVATISSTRSHMSVIASVEEDPGDDEEIETIQRSYIPHAQDSTTEFSQSMLSHSDVPNHLVSARPTGPILTLNVQMSLYDTNLASFISPEALPLQVNQFCHCFHPCISLELLSSIISGVEYLHENNVVHRDLKPANIFLSLSTSRVPPPGSIDISSCSHCPQRECVHITPRIGDFGLVAALGDQCLLSNTMAKPVGTEFYRPEGGKVSEKLDVFALGVVGLEMLCKFSTRMERIEALTRLRRSEFPIGFLDIIGGDSGGAMVQNLLTNMVRADEQQRFDCDAVQQELQKLIEILKT